ncbi:MAG: FAD binding domain-containing protein [Archangiaceae bacterium]|nr:FAD binding domain-containing protein [Archangiaceae bacterium]
MRRRASLKPSRCSRRTERRRSSAGGTDLAPNRKHRLFTPEHVIGLRDVAELHRLGERDGALAIGSMVTLADLARDERVRAIFPRCRAPPLAGGGPQLREMGTLGGNLALDTRCVYHNQTYFWRKALGYCLKKDGTVCHVVKGGQKCVAAASNDTAPVLSLRGHGAGCSLRAAARSRRSISSTWPTAFATRCSSPTS